MRQQLHFARSNRGAGCVSARLLMVPAAEAQTAPRGYVSTSCVLTDDVRSNVSRQDVRRPSSKPAVRSSTEHLPALILGGRASASRRHQPASRCAGKDHGTLTLRLPSVPVAPPTHGAPTGCQHHRGAAHGHMVSWAALPKVSNFIEPRTNSAIVTLCDQYPNAGSECPSVCLDAESACHPCSRPSTEQRQISVLCVR